MVQTVVAMVYRILVLFKLTLHKYIACSQKLLTENNFIFILVIESNTNFYLLKW